jgi:hypothetical protein
VKKLLGPRVPLEITATDLSFIGGLNSPVLGSLRMSGFMRQSNGFCYSERGFSLTLFVILYQVGFEASWD